MRRKKGKWKGERKRGRGEMGGGSIQTSFGRGERWRDRRPERDPVARRAGVSKGRIWGWCALPNVEMPPEI